VTEEEKQEKAFDDFAEKVDGAIRHLGEQYINPQWADACLESRGRVLTLYSLASELWVYQHPEDEHTQAIRKAILNLEDKGSLV